MKKLTTLLLSLLFLCSCAKTIRPKRITEEAFPPEEAIPLVEALEEPFLTLPREGTITGAQLLAYKETSALFDETHLASVVRSVIVTDPEVQDFVLDPDTVYDIRTDMEYPTVFHEDIAVTSAVIRRETYQEEYSFFDKTQLIVTETYNGDAPMMQDFERRYIFETDENGEWILEHCSGVIEYSFAGESPLTWKES